MLNIFLDRRFAKWKVQHILTVTPSTFSKLQFRFYKSSKYDPNFVEIYISQNLIGT